METLTGINTTHRNFLRVWHGLPFPATIHHLADSFADVPAGTYRVNNTDVLFITDTMYPLSAMDMFWTDPAVVRPDGSIPANAESIETYRDRQWRRFSWYRNGVWNPNGNPLLDHFELMQARFVRDLAA